MSLIRSTAAAVVRTTGLVSPRLGAATALPLFMHVDRPRPVADADAATMQRATRDVVRVPGLDRRGADVAVYTWGNGPRTIALAHGWDGRASQFATLVRELVAEGYRVVSFDAPAHGASGGRRTYLVDWIDALAVLQDRHGGFHAVVGHSFGGFAMLVGVAGGIESERVITVSAPAEAESMLVRFQAMLGYGEPVAAAVHDRFAARFFPADPDPFAWLSAVRRPLPPGTPLLVIHDERDRLVPFGEAPRIVAANFGSNLLATSGLGHSRILSSDLFLDAVLGFVSAGRTVRAPAR